MPTTPKMGSLETLEEMTSSTALKMEEQTAYAEEALQIN